MFSAEAHQIRKRNKSKDSIIFLVADNFIIVLVEKSQSEPMGCGHSHSAEKGVAGKSTKQALREAPNDTPTEKPQEEEVDQFNQFVAGYVADYPLKGTVTTYEDYKGYSTSTTNHVSKGKTDRVCKWADGVLLERHRLNHDVFFNPQNPAAWPKEVIAEHTSAPSFADRHTSQQSSYK